MNSVMVVEQLMLCRVEVCVQKTALALAVYGLWTTWSDDVGATYGDKKLGPVVLLCSDSVLVIAPTWRGSVVKMTSRFLEVPLVKDDKVGLLPWYEAEFPLTYWRRVFGEWWWLSTYISVAYVVLVFGGRRLMRDRAAFKLNGVLTVWNIGLAVMSIYAWVRVAPEFFSVLFGENGFHNSICEWPRHTGATAFWSWILALSKVVELGDTAFIVLRKQNLLFLHWYHHITTLMSWWIMYSWYEPVQQWYVVMNSFVHSFMYSYYALRALKIRVPRPIAMMITTIQLLQMVFGVIVNVYSYSVMTSGVPEETCPHRNWLGLKVSFGIYVPYTCLFAKLFYDSYMAKPKGQATPTKKNKDQEKKRS